MLGFVAALFLASAAAGPPPRVAVTSIDEFLRARNEASKEKRLEHVAALKAAAKTVSGDERKLIDRMTRMLEKDEPVEKVVPQLAEIVRALAKLVRGRFDDELAVGGTFLLLPTLAENAELDPAPFRREAMALSRDLVARYPNEGRAHGLFASALMDASADSKLVLAELKRCTELDQDAWCTKQHASLAADLERPRCSGDELKKELTARGSGEAKPFLTSQDFASVSVDAEGNLQLEVTASAKSRLEQETRRLVGKTIVLMLGDEELLAAQVQEPITAGRILVSKGRRKGAFKIQELCQSEEHAP